MSFLTQDDLKSSKEYNNTMISEEDFLRDLRTPPEGFSRPEPGPVDPPGAQPQTAPEDATDDPSGMPPMPGMPSSSLESHGDPVKARYTAKFLVGMMDAGISNGCKMIARAKSAEPYKAAPDEKSDLVEVWAEYLKVTGGDIPPGVLAFMTTFAVYSPRVGQAFIDKSRGGAGSQDSAATIRDLKAKIQKLEEQVKKTAA